jgi:hypothetical protein
LSREEKKTTDDADRTRIGKRSGEGRKKGKRSIAIQEDGMTLPGRVFIRKKIVFPPSPSSTFF